MTASTSPVPPSSRRSPLQLAVSLINQVARLLSCSPRAPVVVRGRNAIERALRLQHYTSKVGVGRVSILVMRSPLPVLALLTVFDASTPLSDPKLGAARNAVAFVRSVLSNAVIALSGELLVMQALGIPTRVDRSVQAAALALLIAAVAEIPWILLAFAWKYPVPNKDELNGVSLLLPLALGVLAVLRVPAATRSAWRRRVVRSSLSIDGVRIVTVALLCLALALFMVAPLWSRVLLLLAVRVAKAHYQRHLSILTMRLPAATVEVAAVSGETMFAVFHAACLAAQPSIWLALGIVTADFLEVGVHLRFIRQPSFQPKSGLHTGDAESAVTATTTSVVDVVRATEGELPPPASRVALSERSYARTTSNIRIEFPNVLSVARPRIAHSRSAKIYCAPHKQHHAGTKRGVVMSALQTRSSAPAIVGNSTRRLALVDSVPTSQQRTNEPPRAIMHRLQPGRNSRHLVSESRSGALSLSRLALSDSVKRRSSGENTRLRNALITCELLLLERFSTLLLLAIYVTAMAMLWMLPNARYNLFLARLSPIDLKQHVLLSLAYFGAEVALMLSTARVANKLGVRALYVVGYALEHYPVVMYAEIVAYCFYTLQRLAMHNHSE